MAAEVAAPAPDCELEGTAGTVSLASLLGRWAVLAFYPADQDPGTQAAWVEKHSLTVPVFSDPEGIIRERKAHRIGLSFEDADWIGAALGAARA